MLAQHDEVDFPILGNSDDFLKGLADYGPTSESDRALLVEARRSKLIAEISCAVLKDYNAFEGQSTHSLTLDQMLRIAGGAC
jgi:hypothetical protein